MEIPVLDIEPALRGSEEDARQVAKVVGDTCEEIGFLVITGHLVPDETIRAIYDTALGFFHLPMEEKLRYTPPVTGVYRGYTPPAASALAASSDVVTPPDLCELFTVNRFDDPAMADRAGRREGLEGFFWPNIWPERPAGFKAAWEEYYAVMEKLALDLMGLFALALDLPRGWFDHYFDDHITNLTANYYAPQPTAPVPGQLRRGAHSDWGSLTILYQDDAPGGLEVLTRGGEWISCPYVPGSFVINLGDLMAFWTNERWVSNVHRVVNPARAEAGRERVSIPFFHQPSYDAVITTIPTCATSADVARSTTSGEWILDKLRKTIY
jgi:isopenicillin N synthase-like dioxygenase